MTGKIAFEAWGNIDPEFILEAAPDADMTSAAALVGSGAGKMGKRPPVHGGWIAAAVCVVIALGIYLGALWMGQDEWNPPAVTGDGTEIFETAEPSVTEPVQTEAEEKEPMETEPMETVPVETEFMETEPSETVPMETKPNETDFPETEPADPSVLFQPFITPHYVVEKIDGQCYLNLYEGNRTFDVDFISRVTFADFDDMFRSITEGDFTQSELIDIRAFLSMTEKGYRVIDPWDMAVPVLPEGYEMERIEWSGNEYEIFFNHPANHSMEVRKNQKKEGWAEALVNEKREGADELIVDGIPAIMTDAYGDKEIHLSLTDEATGREFYVYTRYDRSDDHGDPEAMVSEATPFEIEISGTWEDHYFYVRLYDFKKEALLPKLTKAFILSFGLEKYMPPDGELPLLDTHASYEVEKIDGAYYLTIPSYDFSLIDAYLPADTARISSPCFATLSDMYRAFMVEKRDLTLTEIVQYRLMMDENGRVPLPDLENLLSPVIPHELEEMHSLTFYASGSYSLRTRNTTENEPISFSGGLTEAEWQRRYDLMLEDFYTYKEADPEATRVVQGFFEGLPCTFYEYPLGKNEDPWLLCHVIRVEGDHQQHMFAVFPDSLLFYVEEAGNHFTFDELGCYDGCRMTILGIKGGVYYDYNFGSYGDYWISWNQNNYADRMIIPSKKLMDQFSAAPYIL